jgi:hypothetical protein
VIDDDLLMSLDNVSGQIGHLAMTSATPIIQI